MVLSFNDFALVPGIRDAFLNTENQIWWGREHNLLYQGAIILAATTDEGNTPTDILRAGLVMGGPVSGKITDWDPDALDGSENLYGILLADMKMIDSTGTAADRVIGPILMGGPIKAASIIIPGLAEGLSGKADEFLFRNLCTGRFLLDDDLAGAHRNWGNWRQIRPIGTLEAAGDDAYQVLAADNNILFTNEGEDASMAFTLPAIASVGPGFRVGLLVVTAQECVVTSADGNDIICDNDVAASTITTTTANEEIGRVFECIAISATKWLCIVHGTHPTDATAFAVA